MALAPGVQVLHHKVLPSYVWLHTPACQHFGLGCRDGKLSALRLPCTLMCGSSGGEFHAPGARIHAWLGSVAVAPEMVGFVDGRALPAHDYVLFGTDYLRHTHAIIYPMTCIVAQTPLRSYPISLPSLPLCGTVFASRAAVCSHCVL